MKLCTLILIFSIGLTIGKNCDPTQCPNHKYSRHYYDLKCEPVFKTANDCCPAYYKCSNLEQMENVLDKCFYKNRTFNIHQDIPGPELYSKCSTVHCTCVIGHREKSHPEFLCVHNDCPEFFRPHDPNCIRTYALNRCCSVGNLCGDEITNAKKCTVGNQTYTQGQKIYTQSNNCDRCLCNNKGEVECVDVDCDLELHHAEELRKYCAPKYDHYCCPDDFICPDNTTTVVDAPTKSESLVPGNTCKFGSKTIKIGGTVQLSNPKERCTKCSCILPPLVTCYSDKNCEE